MPRGAARVSERLAPLMERSGTTGCLAFTLGRLLQPGQMAVSSARRWVVLGHGKSAVGGS